MVLWVVVVPFSTCHFPESSGGSSFIIRLPGGERWISGSQGLLKEEYLHCRNTIKKQPNVTSFSFCYALKEKSDVCYFLKGHNCVIPGQHLQAVERGGTSDTTLSLAFPIC